MARFATRPIDPIPEQEFDTFCNPVLSTDRRSPSPVNQNSPTKNKLFSPVKRSPHTSIPIATKAHELPTLPEQSTIGTNLLTRTRSADRITPDSFLSAQETSQHSISWLVINVHQPTRSRESLGANRTMHCLSLTMFHLKQCERIVAVVPSGSDNSGCH